MKLVPAANKDSGLLQSILSFLSFLPSLKTHTSILYLPVIVKETRVFSSQEACDLRQKPKKS